MKGGSMRRRRDDRGIGRVELVADALMFGSMGEEEEGNVVSQLGGQSELSSMRVPGRRFAG
jgi:hypothetical protein